MNVNAVPGHDDWSLDILEGNQYRILYPATTVLVIDRRKRELRVRWFPLDKLELTEGELRGEEIAFIAVKSLSRSVIWGFVHSNLDLIMDVGKGGVNANRSGAVLKYMWLSQDAYIQPSESMVFFPFDGSESTTSASGDYNRIQSMSSGHVLTSDIKGVLRLYEENGGRMSCIGRVQLSSISSGKSHRISWGGEPLRLKDAVITRESFTIVASKMFPHYMVIRSDEAEEFSSEPLHPVTSNGKNYHCTHKFVCPSGKVLSYPVGLADNHPYTLQIDTEYIAKVVDFDHKGNLKSHSVAHCHLPSLAEGQTVFLSCHKGVCVTVPAYEMPNQSGWLIMYRDNVYSFRYIEDNAIICTQQINEKDMNG